MKVPAGHIFRDARVALRGFARTPAFTLTALLAIALGVGSVTAVFSVVDRILFRALPYPHEDRLVSLGITAPIEQHEFMLGADYYEWRGEHSAFAAMTSWAGAADCDLTGDRPERVSCARVAASFLPTLEILPIAGRNFSTDEDLPNGPKAALLTYSLWQSRFAADRSIVGRQVQIDGEPRTVVGVLPENFELPTLNRADILIPQALNPAGQQRPSTGAVLRVFGRLKPGVSIEQAKTALAPYFTRTLQFVPPPFRKEVHIRMRPLRDRQTQDARLASWILFGAVLAVLLIVCANVANLLLARSAARRNEMTIRTALGASRARLIAQGLTESLMLGLVGGAEGCALAWLIVRGFALIAPNGILRLEQASLDARVLAVSLATALLAGLVFGLAPAFAHRGGEMLTGDRATGPRRRWGGPAMAAVQIALSVILLSASGLLLRSFWKLQNVPLGMQPAHVSTAALVLNVHNYSQPQSRSAFFDEVERRAKQIPGVESAAVSDSIPPSGETRTMIYTLIDVQGRPRTSEGTGGMAVWRSVSARFFETLGTPIIRGRAFDDSDRAPGANNVIIGEALRRRLFPNQDPLGQHLRFGNAGPWYTIVGEAGALKNAGLAGNDDPEYYLPRAGADPARRGFLIVRSRLPETTIAEQVRAQIATIDASLPVTVLPMEERVSQLSARPRFNAALLTSFAAIGVLLAAIGLYGLLSFLVAQRTREIGVRMAIGATRHEIVRMILSQAGLWTLAGCLIGVLASMRLPTILGLLLYDTPSLDATPLAAALVILIVTALAAAWIPARRAASVDPMTALRHE